MATVALGLGDLTAFPLFPTVSTTMIPLDHDKQIKLHQQETRRLLVKLYLNLEGYMFQLKTWKQIKLLLNNFTMIPAEGDQAALTLPQEMQLNVKVYNIKSLSSSSFSFSSGDCHHNFNISGWRKYMAEDRYEFTCTSKLGLHFIDHRSRKDVWKQLQKPVRVQSPGASYLLWAPLQVAELVFTLLFHFLNRTTGFVQAPGPFPVQRGS